MKRTDAPASHVGSSAEPEPAASPSTASSSTPEVMLDALDTAETMAPVAAAAITTLRSIEPAAAPAAAPVARSAPIRRSPPFRTVALVGVTAILLAALAFPRRPAMPGSTGPDAPDQTKQAPDQAPSRPPLRHAATASGSPVASSASVAPRAARESTKKAAATKTAANRSDAAKSSVPSASAAPAPLEDAAPKPAEPEPTPVEPAAAVASTERSGLAPVTITGCLEMSVSRDEFRLTETDGTDAPKARSWRTGFLRKRSTPVALVELSDPQALQPQVGKRVAATGLLTSRELRVNSLRVVGPCN